MDEAKLLSLKPELDAFLDRYAPLFGPSPNALHARRFVQGLLKGGERRNAENIAQAMDGGSVRNLQAFLTTGAWDAADVLSEVRIHLIEHLAEPDAVWNSDETGFPKKGMHSVGVARQYSGTMGRTDNCQIGVFANYCSSKGHSFMDRRLYLPAEWIADMARREKAGVPDGVVFRTKPELALEMMTAAVQASVPFQWAGGDCVYGDNPTFVRGVRQLGKWYVLDISSDTHVWSEEPRVIAPEDRPKGKGKKPTKPLVEGKTIPINELVKGLPASAWRRVEVGEGSQGPRMYEYTELWVWFKEEDGLPGAKERLLVRRGTGQEPDLKYHRSNAPPEIPLSKLAQVRGTRWSIEEDIQTGKGECGLDEYETRGWEGWHHHTALSILAQAFLVLQKLRLGGKRGRYDGARSAGIIEPPVGSSRVEHGRIAEMEPLATGTEPPRRRQPLQATARRNDGKGK